MENSPKVSIIAPVYKVELFIVKCIESVLNQTFTNFELILVDDGSPDNCGAICDKYARIDSRVRVFHKENGGVTSARLFGAKESKSKWVTFLDSDDELTPHALEYFMNASKKTDAKVIKGAYKYIYEESGKEKLFNSFVEKEVSFIQFLNKYRSYNIWSALIDRELFLSLYQPPANLKMGEDRVLIYQAIAVNDKVYNIPDITYLYKQNRNSLVATYVNHYSIDTNFRAYIESFDKAIITNKNIKFINREIVKRDCIYHIFIFLGLCKDKDDIRFAKRYLKKYLYSNPLQLSIHLLSKIKKNIKKLF